jgi:hypothetical protein
VSSSLQDTDTRKTRGRERGTETTRPVPSLCQVVRRRDTLVKVRDTPCKDARYPVPGGRGTHRQGAGYHVPGGRSPTVRMKDTKHQGEKHSASDGRTSCVRMKDTLCQDEEHPESG